MATSTPNELANESRFAGWLLAAFIERLAMLFCRVVKIQIFCQILISGRDKGRPGGIKRVGCLGNAFCDEL
jgi:hypothetical protein